MKEGKIEQIYSSKAEQKLHGPVLEKSHLTAEDVSSMADAFAVELKEKIKEIVSPEEQKTFITHFLSSGALLNDRKAFEKAGFSVKIKESGGKDVTIAGATLSFKDEDGNIVSDTFDIDEFDYLLRDIRKAIVARLPQEIADQAVLYLDTASSPHVGINPIFGKDKIYKSGETWGDGKERLAALHKLHNLPEKCPYIMYQTLEIDPRDMSEIQRKLNINSLDYYFVGNYGEERSFEKSLQYFVDALRGAQFLVDHNLRLTDNTLGNIAIDKERDVGVLFDFDGLRQSTDETPYVSNPNYFPPEVKLGSPTKVLESHMVYEYGIALSNLIHRYRMYCVLRDTPEQDSSMLLIQRVDAQSIEMRSKDPVNRPNLKTCVSTLETIFAEL